jgi:hypothetical protein
MNLKITNKILTKGLQGDDSVSLGLNLATFNQEGFGPDEDELKVRDDVLRPLSTQVYGGNCLPSRGLE